MSTKSKGITLIVVLISCFIYLASKKTEFASSVGVPSYNITVTVETFEQYKVFEKDFTRFDLEYYTVYPIESGEYEIIFNIKKDEEEFFKLLESKEYVKRIVDNRTKND